jgi:hypothetical protein
MDIYMCFSSFFYRTFKQVYYCLAPLKFRAENKINFDFYCNFEGSPRVPSEPSLLLALHGGKSEVREQAGNSENEVRTSGGTKGSFKTLLLLALLEEL